MLVTLTAGVSKLSVKSKIVNIIGFVGCLASATTIQFCPYNTEASIDSTYK